MQTLKIELEDNLYQNILHSSVDIQEKVKEFLFDLVDDGYPTITTEEAKKRVTEAMKKYKNGTGVYLNDTQYKDRMKSYMKSLELKYADN